MTTKIRDAVVREQRDVHLRNVMSSHTATESVRRQLSSGHAMHHGVGSFVHTSRNGLSGDDWANWRRTPVSVSSLVRRPGRKRSSLFLCIPYREV